MLPVSVIQFVTVIADIAILIFVFFYILSLRKKEKLIDKEKADADANFQKTVEDSLSKEKKLLEDAAFASNQIITETKYVTDSSKAALEEALQKMEHSLEDEANLSTKDFSKTYSASLQHIATQSLSEFQSIIHSMEQELQRQTNDFSATMLPELQKELDSYRQMRLQQADRTINHVIQEVSQEILNKALSIEDHQQLLIEALEKAKKEGIFS
jgi:hypothetical protein